MTFAAVAFAALGCRPITEPAPFETRFSVTRRDGSTSHDEAAYGTAAGTVVVAGQIVGGNACLELEPNLSVRGEELTVDVMVREPTPGCPRAATAYAYTLRVARVPTGVYHLVVLHSFRTATQSGASTVIDVARVEVR